VLLTLIALRTADLLWSRTQKLDVARARAANLSFLLSEYTREAFAAADASLRHLAIDSRRVGGPGAPEAEWTASLAAVKTALAGVGSLSIVDAGGVIRHSTQPLIVGQSRREYLIFRTLQK